MTGLSASKSATPLSERLIERIRESGPMPLSDYMSACLYDRDFGFYNSQMPFGVGGHFITAPEISQVFGELIGLWSAAVWSGHLASPQQFTLAELGPGRGTLMADALRAAGLMPPFISAAQVLMVETSAVLTDVQRATLQAAPVPVMWAHNLSLVNVPAIVIGNEFLDAIPVNQWVKDGGRVAKRAVGLSDTGELVFTLIHGAQPPEWIAAQLAGADDGTIAEHRDTSSLVKELLRIGSHAPLAGVLIDYGHASGELGDTLQAVREHHAEHPLASPGLADITSHVDFKRFLFELEHAGLAVDGPTTQAEFFGRLGIMQRASKLIAANPEKAGTIEAGVVRLMAPNGMGTRFKVIGFRSKSLPPLPGF